MTAPFFLIVLFSFSQGSAMTSTPMQSKDLCEQAAVQVKAFESTFSNIRTQCVRGEA